MPLSFFFSSRRRHTRCSRDWSSDVCSSDLAHLNISGVSGLATKTSAVEFLLGSIFQHFPPHKGRVAAGRSEEHTSELQSRLHIVCRLLLEKKKNITRHHYLSPPLWISVARSATLR